MSQKQKSAPRITAEAVKRFVTVLAGSLFVQIFCWVMYSYLRMSVWMCGLSAVITAILYHFLQMEEQTGLSRRNVFFAAILSPFVLSLTATVFMMMRHKNLQHLSAELDGVSPMTEMISLYAARLVINGAALLIFAAFHSIYLKHHPPVAVPEDSADEG